MENINQLKVTIELDLSKPSDQKLIEIISRVKAMQEQGITPSIMQAVADTQNEQPLASANQLIESGNEVNKAVNDLGDKLPCEKRKMTTKERASAAAKARWARDKARREGRPLPPTARERKKKEKAQNDGLDYSRAAQEPADQYKVDSLELRHNNFMRALTQPPPAVDGREIMSGSWQARDDHQQFINGEDNVHMDLDLPDYMNEDNYVREIHERAKSYEK